MFSDKFKGLQPWSVDWTFTHFVCSGMDYWGGGGDTAMKLAQTSHSRRKLQIYFLLPQWQKKELILRRRAKCPQPRARPFFKTLPYRSPSLNIREITYEVTALKAFCLPSIPGAELEAECSTTSWTPSMFSLFSACFFKVLVLEGSMGKRGKYGTMDEEDAVLPSSSATSVRNVRGIVGTESSKGRGKQTWVLTRGTGQGKKKHHWEILGRDWIQV